MGTATIGALKVVLGLDSAAFENGLTAAQKHLRGVGRQFQAVGQQLSAVGAGMSVAITAPLIAAGFAASRAATEADDAMGQVEASLTSMGNASGRTAEQLGGLASGIMRHSLLDDDDVLRQVTANLLTFGRLSGTVFDRAQQVIVDYSAKTGRDLLGSTMLIGRALQDPIKGMNQLGRAGIILSDTQKALIRSMDAAGNTAGAQGILLAELESQYRGSAQAAQDTDPYDSLRDSLNDLSESMGAIINTHLKPFIDGVASLADRFNTLSPQMQTFVVAGAAIAAALGPALVVIGSVVSAVGALTTALAAGGVLAGLAGFAVAAAPFIAAAAGIAAAVYVFRDDLAPVFEEFRTAATAAVGPALTQLMTSAREAFAAMAPAISTILSVVGPILAQLTDLFLKAFGPVLLTTLRVLAAGLTNTVGIITRVLQLVAALLTGDWSAAWRTAGSLVMEVVRGIGRLIEAVFPGSIEHMRRLYEGARTWLQERLGAVFNWVSDKAKAVGDAFFNLYDRVVGHSYVPDMVTEVGQWMARLDQNMVAPARRTTQSTAEAFEAMRERAKAALEGVMTDRERLETDLRRSLDDARNLVGTPGGLSQQQYDLIASRRRADFARDSAGLDAEGLTNDTRSNPTFDFLEPFNRSMEAMNRHIDTLRDRFADAFERGIDAAIRGDWRGVLESIVGDTFRTGLRSLGAQLFDLGGGKTGGFSLNTVFSSLFKSLPKLASPAAALSSAAVAFAGPSLTDIYSPSKDSGFGGSMRVLVDVNDDRFNAYVDERATPVAERAGGQALTGARKVVPAEMARSDRYRRGS